MTKTQLEICLIAAEARESSQKNIIAGLDNYIEGLEKELFLERQDSESAASRSAEIEKERDIRDLEQQADACHWIYKNVPDLSNRNYIAIQEKSRELRIEAEALKADKL